MRWYLPKVTKPWNTRIERQHEPRPGSYPDFRSCLRWEFGFSCAFCQLHEADLMLGAEGWGLMQIEHSIPQSKGFDQRHVYTNCFFICARCNQSRGASPNEDEGNTVLLDPCAVAWGDHFARIGDEILPHPADSSALYTCESYDLNDLRKVRLRERRRTWIENHADALLEILEEEPKLLDQVVETSETSTVQELLGRLDAARGLRTALWLLLKNLERFKPIPDDHDAACRCGHTKHHNLPGVLSEQTVGLEDLLDQARARRMP